MCLLSLLPLPLPRRRLLQEPAFTVVDSPLGFAGTLDYILFTPPHDAASGGGCGLLPTAVLAPPNAAVAEEARRRGLPSGPFPSDHLLLAADFAIC
jgi:hypothetical protein